MTNIHPLDPEDAEIAAALRVIVSPSKGARPGIEARGQFDVHMESVLPRDDVTFEADTISRKEPEHGTRAHRRRHGINR